jgi:hypothetical protein
MRPRPGHSAPSTAYHSLSSSTYGLGVAGECSGASCGRPSRQVLEPGPTWLPKASSKQDDRRNGGNYQSVLYAEQPYRHSGKRRPQRRCRIHQRPATASPGIRRCIVEGVAVSLSLLRAGGQARTLHGTSSGFVADFCRAECTQRLGFTGILLRHSGHWRPARRAASPRRGTSTFKRRAETLAQQSDNNVVRGRCTED